MKMMQRYVKTTGFFVAAALVLGACGGTEWGIDHGSVPMCNDDPHDSSAAILVQPGTKIEATEPGTTIRVWHYSNSDKMVCVLTGSVTTSKGN